MSPRVSALCVASVCLLGSGVPIGAQEYRAPMPGSPTALTDWRWLARPLAGRQTVLADLRGRRTLEPVADGRYAMLKLDGPCVLDHLISMNGAAVFAIEVDGQALWTGTLDDAIAAAARDDAPFPAPIACGGAGMRHLLAPVGFASSLVITVDKPACSHHLSYRLFVKGAEVQPATPGGAYAAALRGAAEVWRQGGETFHAVTSSAPMRSEFVLQAKSRAAVLECKGGGELTHLEFHVNPALTGSLRSVLIDVFYDGQAEPALRMPITDFVGLPHPWNTGSAAMAAGLRPPWTLYTPRVHYPEVTLYCNLPMPFARGLRIELVNRSADVRFAGVALADVQPLSEQDALAAGRLCGTRLVAPVSPGTDLQPLIRLAGPGQLVGLGLFLTGNATFPGAARTSMMSLTTDDLAPIIGHGLLPLWFAGAYAGPYGSPLWTHARMEDQYCGVVRYFVTDPIPFTQGATFAYAPGPASAGMPTGATVLAFWYRFGDVPFAAPALPEQAESLPYSTYGPGNGVGRDSRLAWSIEAEDLAPVAVAHGGEVRVVEDIDHNFHPSRGTYLHITSDQPGDCVDCLVPFPASRYVAVGTEVLWGPNRAAYELDVISKTQAQSPPELPQDPGSIRGRAVGSVALTAPVFSGGSLAHVRDGTTRYSLPFCNPAPAGEGVIRFICQTKPPSANTYLLKLDRIRMEMPPPTPAGWREFEDGSAPDVSGEAVAQLPKYGRFAWSGWGALDFTAPRDGQAVIRALVLDGPAVPAELRIRGSLGPQQGGWTAGVNGGTQVALAPASNDQELVEWIIPMQGVTVLGEMTIDLRCTAVAERTPGMRQDPKAQLVLDCWTIQ